MKLEAIEKWKAKLPEQVRGEHLWIIAGMWRVMPPIADRVVDLDLENLLSLDGPGCFWCEEHWTPELAAKPCKGG